MEIKFKNLEDIVDILPSIGREYMIQIGFANGEAMCYCFLDRDKFLKEYKSLSQKIIDVYGG